MPFSGGTDWSDTYARSGIGDGDMLTAGTNATTTGAVDSNEFIEDHKPSMYDIMSDIFDGPTKIKKRGNRAVSLEAMAKHMHNVMQSEQEGKTFRTVRRSPPNNDRKMENRQTDALFFVEGSVPARFAVDRYHHFDGWDWTQLDLKAEGVTGKAGAKTIPIIIEQHFGKPWYVVHNIERDFLNSSRAHRVKMMRLETDTLPASSLLKSWHIYRVEDKDLFYWNDQGSIAMRGDFIPTHTMIDQVSLVPNYHDLRSSKNLQLNYSSPYWERIDQLIGVRTTSGSKSSTFDPRESNEENLFIQIPDNDSKSRVVSLAKEWTEGHEPGWNQVEAIVNRLRTEFEYDPLQVASQEGQDSVGSFLDNKAGPSYLFATTAAQLLRAAGYRTRIAKGFLVTKEDYDRFANQSIVTRDNLHMWPEVCIDGWHWIPVEPTPGFPIPYSTETWWQWANAKIATVITWIRRNPVISISFLTLLILCYRFRQELVVLVCEVAWRVAYLVIPSRRLKTTRQLIDVRFWAAGLPRPSFASVSDWFLKVDSTDARDFVRCWLRDNFCGSRTAGLSTSEVHSACRSAASALTFRKIKKFAKHLNL